MEQFCSIFTVSVQIWPPFTLCKWKQIIEKCFWTGPFICHRFRSSQRWWHFSPLSRPRKNGAILTQFSLFESKFDHLIPYVNESKALRRVSGLDPLICHRFLSSQRWWHFSPLSRLGKMEQFCSIFRCLSPNLTTLYLMYMKANHWEEFLDRTL